jgi:hypothetical protein
MDASMREREREREREKERERKRESVLGTILHIFTIGRRMGRIGVEDRVPSVLRFSCVGLLGISE